MTTETILKVIQLEKTYPNGFKALKNVSFTVNKGEFLVIIGLSGSGKSTLLKCLNQLHKATSGQILFNNQDVTQAEGKEIKVLRTKIAMIFQSFNLIDRFSVIKNVLIGSLSRLDFLSSVFNLHKPSAVEEAKKYLQLVGISEKAYFRVDRLSGGQKQRVAIARALMQAPEILLADEPVASLDPATCHVVMNYLKKINEEMGLTIICNLHFLSLVRQYATRVIALKAGEIVYEGSPKNIDESWFKKIYGESAKDVFVN